MGGGAFTRTRVDRYCIPLWLVPSRARTHSCAQSNFEATNRTNFSRVKIQLTIALSNVTLVSLLDEKWVVLSLEAIKAYARGDPYLLRFPVCALPTRPPNSTLAPKRY